MMFVRKGRLEEKEGWEKRKGGRKGRPGEKDGQEKRKVKRKRRPGENVGQEKIKVRKKEGRKKRVECLCPQGPPATHKGSLPPSRALPSRPVLRHQGPLLPSRDKKEGQEKRKVGKEGQKIAALKGPQLPSRAPSCP